MAQTILDWGRKGLRRLHMNDNIIGIQGVRSVVQSMRKVEVSFAHRSQQSHLRLADLAEQGEAMSNQQVALIRDYLEEEVRKGYMKEYMVEKMRICPPLYADDKYNGGA